MKVAFFRQNNNYSKEKGQQSCGIRKSIQAFFDVCSIDFVVLLLNGVPFSIFVLIIIIFRNFVVAIYCYTVSSSRKDHFRGHTADGNHTAAALVTNFIF